MKKYKLMAEERAFEKGFQKLGSVEKAAALRAQFNDLENHRKPVGCVYDTVDGLIIEFIKEGYSHIQAMASLGDFRLKLTFQNASSKK